MAGEGAPTSRRTGRQDAPLGTFQQRSTVISIRSPFCGRALICREGKNGPRKLMACSVQTIILRKIQAFKQFSDIDRKYNKFL